MAEINDSTSLILVGTATGVQVDIDVDVRLNFNGGPFSQLYLSKIDMTVRRSTDDITYTDLATYNILSQGGGGDYYAFNGTYQHIDTTAVSGTTYYYTIKNRVEHVEVAGAPN